MLLAGAIACAVTGLAFAQSQNDLAAQRAPLAQADGPLTLTIGEGSVPFVAMEMVAGESPAPATLELEVAGSSGPLDMSIAQRATIGASDNGRRRTTGSELRIGQGLVARRQTGEGDTAYMFIASDDEALTWRPGARRTGAALSLQDQVQVGDRSAGFAMERGGVQASIAYVEREASTQVGVESFSQQEQFAGVTITMRH